MDDRVYGYRENSDKPEWLYPSDVKTPYVFHPSETVKSLTYDGSVTMTAQYQYAYTFDDSGSTLLEYVGVDEKVTIPDNDGELKTLAEGAIKDNEIILNIKAKSDGILTKSEYSNNPDVDLKSEVKVGDVMRRERRRVGSV